MTLLKVIIEGNNNVALFGETQNMVSALTWIFSPIAISIFIVVDAIMENPNYYKLIPMWKLPTFIDKSNAIVSNLHQQTNKQLQNETNNNKLSIRF